MLQVAGTPFLLLLFPFSGLYLGANIPTHKTQWAQSLLHCLFYEWQWWDFYSLPLFPDTASYSVGTWVSYPGCKAVWMWRSNYSRG